MANPQYAIDSRRLVPATREQSSADRGVRQPLVSLGLPVYNGERYLAQALECLLAQSFTDFELIISDNASSDATEQICREHAARDSRIVYYRQPENLGAIRNFNFVFEASSGEYFKWASYDDLCEPTFLEKTVAVLEAEEDVVVAYSRSDMVDASGQSWKHRLPSDYDELERTGDGELQWKGHPRTLAEHPRPSHRFASVLLGTNWCVDSYGLIRSAALRQTRLLVELYGAEKVLMGELSLLGKSRMLGEQLFSQRIHPGASSYQDSSAAQQQFAAARYSKPFISTRLSIFFAHWGAIRHARLTSRDRLGCYVALVRYILQVGKWRKVIQTAWKRQGVGGGGKRMIDAATAPFPKT